MQKSSFYYDLPKDLIADRPAISRDKSRLLTVGEDGEIQHQHFKNLCSYLTPRDILVFNNTKVIPARIFGVKETGGKVEIMLDRVLASTRVLCQVKASKSPKLNSSILLEDDSNFKIIEKHENGFFELEYEGEQPLFEMLKKLGHIPLPPYIERNDDVADIEDYQTVYAKEPGAVAAPTAGLHFTDELFEDIESKNISCVEITLHVGAGTYQPVRSEVVEQHRMHKEPYIISQDVADKINAAKQGGGRVIAIGTTSVRTLESAYNTESGLVEADRGDTDIFIYPGKSFNVVDGLITNFHLPESSLIMLVSAFVGYERTMKIYREAIQERYRFFSYGDSMFLSKNPKALMDMPPA